MAENVFCTFPPRVHFPEKRLSLKKFWQKISGILFQVAREYLSSVLLYVQDFMYELRKQVFLLSLWRHILKLLISLILKGQCYIVAAVAWTPEHLLPKQVLLHSIPIIYSYNLLCLIKKDSLFHFTPFVWIYFHAIFLQILSRMFFCG